MSARRFCLGLLALPLLMAADEVKGPPKGWKTFSPADKSFSVWVPDKGGRRRESTRNTSVRGVRLKLNLLQVQPANGPTFGAMTVIISTKATRQIPINDRIEIFRDLFVDQVRGKIDDEKEIKQGRLSGKEFVIKADQGMARLRIFALGGRVYQAVVAGTAQQVESKDADTFLDSFKLPAKATEVASTKEKPEGEGDSPKKEKDEGDGAKEKDKGGDTKVKWTLDLAKMKVPATAASGKIMGADFKVEGVKLEVTGALTLRQGTGFFPDAAIIIFLPIKTGAGIAGKSFQLAPGKTGFGKWFGVHLQKKVKGEQLPKTDVVGQGYAMKLDFGKAKDGKVPGKIYICLPDAAKTVVAGTFTLEVE